MLLLILSHAAGAPFALAVAVNPTPLGELDALIVCVGAGVVPTGALNVN